MNIIEDEGLRIPSFIFKRRKITNLTVALGVLFQKNLTFDKMMELFCDFRR